jgi:hypothetical protein
MIFLTHIGNIVKLGDKEQLDKELLAMLKEVFNDHQPFHIINLLLDRNFCQSWKC